MSSDKNFLRFILQQLSSLEGITARPMMGEFLLYFQGKLIGGIYDDRLLLKPTPSLLSLVPSPLYALPYEGGKQMLLIEEVDDAQFLTELIFNAYTHS